MRNQLPKLNEQRLTPAHNQQRQDSFREQQQRLDESCNGPFLELVDSAAGRMQ